MRKWTDKDGNKRTSAEVLAEHIYFGDSKKDGDSAPAGGTQVGSYDSHYGGNSYGGGVNVGAADFDDDSDLPF